MMLLKHAHWTPALREAESETEMLAGRGPSAPVAVRRPPSLTSAKLSHPCSLGFKIFLYPYVQRENCSATPSACEIDLSARKSDDSRYQKATQDRKKKNPREIKFQGAGFIRGSQR